MEIKKWKVSCLVLQLLLMLSSIHGASWREAKQEEVRPGKCPHYDSKKDFTPEQFAGTWFVANQYQTGGHKRFLDCQKLELTSKSDNNLSFDIKGQVRATPALGIQTLGEAVIPDVNTPSVMRWSWNYFPNMIDYVTVLDTDYDNYAVIVLCQDFGLLHTVYPILMTREMPLELSDTYTEHHNLAQTLFPFPVYTGRNNVPNTCLMEKYFKGVTVENLDVDETVQGIFSFFKMFA